MRTFQAWNRDLHKYPPVIWDSENDENGPLIDDEFFKMMMFNSYVNSLEGMFFLLVSFLISFWWTSEYSSCWLKSLRLGDGFLWLVIGKEVQLPIGSMVLPYMVTFTIIIPPMLAYIPYMDPMGYE